MKNRLFAFFTFLCMVLTTFGGFVLPAAAENYPYARDMALYSRETTFLVETQEDLAALSSAVINGRSTEGHTFLQTADIEMSGEFTPIGLNNDNNSAMESIDTIFKGTYDGQHHTISNLTINKTAQNGVGLFGACYQATIKNLGIESGTVTGKNRVGGIAGYADDCILINCYNRADIKSLSGTDGTAGLAGVARNGAEFYGCFNEGKVEGSVVSMGGIAGWGQNNITVIGCYNGGTLINNKSGNGYIDAISRNDSNGGRDFSTCYYLKSSCSVNAWGAIGLDQFDELTVAYTLNNATGIDTNAFGFDAAGELCFSGGDSINVSKISQQSYCGGVTLAGEDLFIAGDSFTVPAVFCERQVDYCLYEDHLYLPDETIEVGQNSTVTYYLKGDYPSVTEVEEYPDEAIYTVATAAELAAMADLVAEGYDFDGATVYIIKDLDFSAYTEWTPIGYIESQSSGTVSGNSYGFLGNLNGQGHRLSNINFTVDGPFQALFAYMEGSTVEHLILDEGQIIGNSNRIGVIAALLKDGTARDIENHVSVYSTSKISNLNMGLFALTYNTNIEQVMMSGTVGEADSRTQENGSIGGCGYDAATTISYSFSTAIVNGGGSSPVGYRCTLKNCPEIGSEEMTREDFLGGKAAWFMNTCGGIKPSSGRWTNGEAGPTLAGNTAIHKLEVIALTTEGEELEIFDLFCEAGKAVSFPERAGYTLFDILLGDELLEDGWIMPAADQTVYLYYECNPYSITYHLNGGTLKEALPEERVMGERVPLPKGDGITKAGFGFAGWYETEDFSGEPLTEISADLSREVILYAKWVTPTLITTADQLCALHEGDLSGCYSLGADIDLSDCDYTPIGTAAAPFKGHFDGNGYTISGLKIESDQNYQGLFGYNEGHICNVTLAEDCIVTGNNYVGGIAGFNSGTVVDCLSYATVNGQTTPSKQYTLMSQNLCIWGGGSDTDIDSVSTRQPWMKRRIQEKDPDFIGFQEGSPAWVSYLSQNITDTYTFMYQYREPESNGTKESAPIAYKTADYDLLDTGVFWLSETPDVCSKGWDAGHWRICHWMVLRDKENGQKIGIYNTHFDLTDASKKGAAGVMQERLQQALEEYPDMILLSCGDFNSEETSEPYSIMTTNGIVDARYTAPITTDAHTHADGAGWDAGSRIIDYIFGHEERVIFDEFDVLDERYVNNERLSDHNGVLAKFRAPNGKNIGGIVGANDGTAKGLLMRGSVSGVTSVGLAVGTDTGNADYLYAVSNGLVPIIGDKENPDNSGTDSLYDFDSLAFLWRINRATLNHAFTLSGEEAVVAKGEVGVPVRITDHGSFRYALSGSTYTIDTTGYSNPVCSVNGNYIEGNSFTVPKETCVIAIQEAATCQNHSYGEWKSVDESTHIRACSADPSHVETATHRWGEEQAVPATCKEPSSVQKTCMDCGYLLILQGEPAEGHTYGEWTAFDGQSHLRICENNSDHKEYALHQYGAPQSFGATCGSGAGLLYTCSDCGYAKKEYTSLPLGHQFGTCEAGAEQGHLRKCLRDPSHILYEAHTISAAVNVEADCEQSEGIRYTCAECAGQWMVVYEEASGHSYGTWQPFDSRRHVRYCANNEDHIEKAKHRWDEGSYHEASCTEAEYTRYTCLDCNDHYDEIGTKAHGHSYGPWAVDKEQGEEESGLMKRVCSVCKDEDERVIPCKNDPAVYAVLKEVDLAGNVTVDIMIQNNPGFAGFGMEITYDLAVMEPAETDAVVKGEVVQGMHFSENAETKPGVITVIAVAIHAAEADGRICTLKFKLKEGAGEETLLGLRILPIQTIDEENQPITIYDQDLNLSLATTHTHDYFWDESAQVYRCYNSLCDKEYDASADIDGDDHLTTADAALLLRYLLGEAELEQQVADFNQNGKAAIHDVVIILRLLNGKV